MRDFVARVVTTGSNGLRRGEQLEPLGLGPVPVSDEHVQDRDAFEVDVGFDLHDIADLRARRSKTALDHATRFASACRAPRPRAVGRRLVSSISIRRGIGSQT